MARYLTKPVDAALLRDTLRRSAQAGRLTRARRELGCDVLQGYLFARPQRPFAAVQF